MSISETKSLSSKYCLLKYEFHIKIGSNRLLWKYTGRTYNKSRGQEKILKRKFMGQAFEWIIFHYAHRKKVISMEEGRLNKEETVEGEAMDSRTIIWGNHRLHAGK